MPKVSVIVPVYNAEKYLATTLDSVLSQTFTDTEIICVNDGSTDKSPQILEGYRERDDRVKVVSQTNGGGSAARNTGIEHSTGDYIMFLDSDDLYTDDIIAAAYSRAKKTGADIVLYNFARFVGKPTRLAVKSKISPGDDVEYFTKDTFTDRFFNDLASITWNKLIKRSVITKHKLTFDVGLSHNHDVDFSIRLMLAAESYSWLNQVGYYYRTNSTGLTATKRSDPTNVLKILINLNQLVTSKHASLKRSFDNYVVDMIIGTLDKYAEDAHKQKQVFDFAYEVAIPSIGLKNKDDGYFFSRLANVFRLVELNDYDGYIRYTKSPKRRLRAKLRKLYDMAQVVLSRLAV